MRPRVLDHQWNSRTRRSQAWTRLLGVVACDLKGSIPNKCRMEEGQGGKVSESDQKTVESEVCWRVCVTGLSAKGGQVPEAITRGVGRAGKMAQ